MKVINKQKFLAELGRLLTFMAEEDRLETLALYDSLFDSAVSEQALLQFFVSPTRQAVVLARAYQSGKISTVPSSSDSDIESNPTPAHILAAESIRHDAEIAGIISADKAESSVILAEQLPTAEVPAEIISESTSETDAVKDAPISEPAVADVTEITDDTEHADAALTAETEAAAENENAPEKDNTVVDAVDNFLAGFAIEGNELAEPETDKESLTADKDENDLSYDPVDDDFSAPLETKEKLFKPNPLLLVLYLIPAVPTAALVTLLLLIPTFFSLALSVSALAAGVMLIAAAFGGFAMLSDILVVLGGALAVLAFGILCAWLFIWFICGAISGFIRALCRLGKKLCFKEVCE